MTAGMARSARTRIELDLHFLSVSTRNLSPTMKTSSTTASLQYFTCGVWDCHSTSISRHLKTRGRPKFSRLSSGSVWFLDSSLPTPASQHRLAGNPRLRDESLPKGPRFASESLDADT